MERLQWKDIVHIFLVVKLRIVDMLILDNLKSLDPDMSLLCCSI